MSSDQEGVVFVTGAQGMLAYDFVRLAKRDNRSIVISDLSDESTIKLDITDKQAVMKAVSDYSPGWIVNLAAYTQVDRAENEREQALAVNARGVLNLATAAKDSGARMLHVSTDYVFGGGQEQGFSREPFTETDTPKPCGVYGESKYLGECHLLETLSQESLILRTSWLHGIAGPNFVDAMLRLANERSEVSVVNDQRGSPTWTGWLAEILWKMIDRDASGVFHASSRGDITWCEFAKEVFLQAEKKISVLPQSTAELNRPAPRPFYSTLDVSKLESTLGEECISWKQSVKKHLAALVGASECAR